MDGSERNISIIPLVEAAVRSITGAPSDFGYSRSRVRECVDARRTLYYILNNRYGLKSDEIAEIYGFSRTNVLQLINRTKDIMSFVPSLKSKIRRVETLLDSSASMDDILVGRGDGYNCVKISKTRLAHIMGIKKDKLIITD